MSGEWTIERVKEELPFIHVFKHQHDLGKRRVVGRRLAKARILTDSATYEIAWERICEALNGLEPLRLRPEDVVT